MTRTTGRYQWVSVLLLLAGCTAVPVPDAAPDAVPGAPSGRVAVEARADVMVMLTPLGDVAAGSVPAGATATAVCRVTRATSMTGIEAGAVKVTTGDLVGYAPVEVLAQDPADRRPTFDRDELALARLLPLCPR